MFTGIIEDIGIVKGITSGASSKALKIYSNKIMNGVKVGDSIAVNGVCLTATSVGSDFFTADVMAETLRRSSLNGLFIGSRVNLERAMPADGRFGGHIVSGHIDGTGTITDITTEDNAVWYTIKAEDKLLRYIVEKGSVALDGISLTVAYVDSRFFKVSIIPHTLSETILKDKKVRDVINIETDIIGKYVEKLIGFDNRNHRADKKSGLDEKTLMENGFFS